MIKKIINNEDADQCDKLLTKLIQDENKYNVNLKDNIVIKNYFKAMLRNPQNILLGEIRDNKIVGYLFLKIIFDDTVKDPSYLIDGLYVDDKYRQLGIGSNLIEEAIKYVQDKHIRYLEVNAMANNQIAKKLYEKYGFVSYRINYRKTLEK
jgi:ribosomal protein S18 acetylase RimI-like enzyme